MLHEAHTHFIITCQTLHTTLLHSCCFTLPPLYLYLFYFIFFFFTKIKKKKKKKKKKHHIIYKFAQHPFLFISGINPDHHFTPHKKKNKKKKNKKKKKKKKQTTSSTGGIFSSLLCRRSFLLASVLGGPCRCCLRAGNCVHAYNMIVACIEYDSGVGGR
ncbi:unnamed protein product [Camellia sinensis]